MEGVEWSKFAEHLQLIGPLELRVLTD
jgi:hypothetical protein